MVDWEQVVARHGPMVWRTLCRLLRHDADAADCFQRTLISAFEFSRAQQVLHWPALLRRLAVARAIEALRRRQRFALRSCPLADRDRADDRALPPSAAAEESELAEHLRDALADLDERLAQVFCLACIEGCTYQEIADQLGITVNHVGVLLNRARASLRERLQAHDPTCPHPTMPKGAPQ